jgi:hypothetical protein
VAVAAAAAATTTTTRLLIFISVHGKKLESEENKN